MLLGGAVPNSCYYTVISRAPSVDFLDPPTRLGLGFRLVGTSVQGFDIFAVRTVVLRVVYLQDVQK